MKHNKYKYEAVVEYIICNKKYSFSSFYKRVNFCIPLQLFTQIKEYSLNEGLIEGYEKCEMIIKELTKDAINSFNHKRNVFIKNISFLDWYYIKLFKDRLVNQRVDKKRLRQRNKYVMNWFEKEYVIECEITLKIKNNVIKDIKTVNFYRIINKKKKQYCYSYAVALGIYDNLIQLYT